MNLQNSCFAREIVNYLDVGKIFTLVEVGNEYKAVCLVEKTL